MSEEGKFWATVWAYAAIVVTTFIISMTIMSMTQSTSARDLRACKGENPSEETIKVCVMGIYGGGK